MPAPLDHKQNYLDASRVKIARGCPIKRVFGHSELHSLEIDDALKLVQICWLRAGSGKVPGSKDYNHCLLQQRLRLKDYDTCTHHCGGCMLRRLRRDGFIPGSIRKHKWPEFEKCGLLLTFCSPIFAAQRLHLNHAHKVGLH